MWQTQEHAGRIWRRTTLQAAVFREAVSCYQTEAVYGLRAVFYSVLLRRFAMLNLDEDAILVSAGAS